METTFIVAGGVFIFFAVIALFAQEGGYLLPGTLLALIVCLLGYASRGDRQAAHNQSHWLSATEKHYAIQVVDPTRFPTTRGETEQVRFIQHGQSHICSFVMTATNNYATVLCGVNTSQKELASNTFAK